MTKEELEKEAEEYRLSLITKLRPKLQEGCNCKELTDIEKAYLAGAEPREKHIAILEKENAELKEKLESSEKVRDYWKESAFDWRHKFFEKRSTKRLVKKSKQLAKANEKLIKAKKMISNLLYVYQLGKNELAIARIRAEAEQFLKEAEA